MYMHNGFAIALAWPETLCKQAGAWYDAPLSYLGFNRNGYYKVGHSAIVLIDDATGSCHYFDFGRYHAPHGHGRVRSGETDHDLKIKTKAKISERNKEIHNLKEILSELYNNPSTHGTGAIFGAVTRINYAKAMHFTKLLQDKVHIQYGPLLPNGTNCSRFVNSAIKAGKPAFSKRIKLQFPPTISPTPMWNLKAVGGEIVRIDQSCAVKVNILSKQKLELIKSSWLTSLKYYLHPSYLPTYRQEQNGFPEKAQDPGS